MQEPSDVKMYFFVDESGDPNILGRKGRDLLAEGKVSKTFMVGYVETSDPGSLSRALEELRAELVTDEYLREIPSLASSLKGFHANKDCPEVKEKVFRVLRKAEYQAYVVVARKDESLFRKKFDLSAPKLYEYLIVKLFENRLHKYKSIDIYFASMGNTVREHTMGRAIQASMDTFRKKWGRENENSIRVFVQEASQHPMLQVIDYTLWTVNRIYERGDFRYYNYLLERISLVQDIFDQPKYPNTYYTPMDPLDANKISPTGG
ncbi:MAG: DUF3800 domain-containing protein [Rectinemataceae bacterium]|jgi:hypothetical protein